MVDRLHKFFHDSDYFPFPTEVQAVVCAWVAEDTPADQEQDVMDCLGEMSLEPIHMRRTIFTNGANEMTNGAAHTSSYGECLVLRGVRGSPQIYLDDELVRLSRR